MNKPDRSKIQNPADYAMNKESSANPSFTSPSMNHTPSQNRFTVLGNIPPLPTKLTTFAQAASSSSKNQSKEHSSESMNSSPISQPSQILHKYKSYQPKLFPVEPEYQHMKNARELVTKVFPPGWDFLPEDQNKNQKFYEFILVDSGSVLLSHTPCKYDPDHKRIAFSKCTIKNVLSLAQWSHNPWQGKRFSQPFVPQTYNYFDYQKAWYNTFFLQNNRYQHSWFFTFDKVHEIKNLPLWFDEWWKLFGAETSILPSPLCNKLLEYSKNFPSPAPFNLFPPELYFFLHFNIPWILSWDYNFISPNPDNNIKYIVRTISIKWWDKYDYDDIITKIMGLSRNQSTDQNQFLLKKSINQAKLASSSSKQEFRKHLLETLSQLSDDEDEDEPVLAGYSQDPYADYADLDL